MDRALLQFGIYQLDGCWQIIFLLYATVYPLVKYMSVHPLQNDMKPPKEEQFKKRIISHYHYLYIPRYFFLVKEVFSISFTKWCNINYLLSLKAIKYKDEGENWGFQWQLKLPESTCFLRVRFILVNFKPYLSYRFFEILKHFHIKTFH